MFGFGPMEMAIGAGVLLVGGVAAFSSRTSKLVLKKLVVREAATGEVTPVIELVGRQQGMISFLLTIAGISPITDLRLTHDEVCCNSTSVFGRQNHAVPLRAISSVAAGVRKPIGYLIMSCVFAIVGVIGGLRALWTDGLVTFLVGFVVCGAFAALFIWLYVVNKRFFVNIFTQGGPPILLSLKPNVIEGVPLDLERALEVVKIIRGRVIASTVPIPVATPTVMPTPSPNGDDSAQPAPGLAFGATTPAAAAVGAVVPGPSSFPSPYEFNEYDDVRRAAPSRPEDLLLKARDLIKTGKRQDAITILRDIVMQFPSSPEAGIARTTLEKAGITV